MNIQKRYIEVEVNGALRKFNKLTPYDRAEIAEKVRKERRAQLEANLAHLKDPQQVTVELESFDAKFPQQQVMRPYILTEVGMLDVFHRALKAGEGAEAEKILRDFAPDEDEAFELAAALCGVKLSPATKPAEDNSAYGDSAPEPPNPQKPEEDSYQTPPAI